MKWDFRIRPQTETVGFSCYPWPISFWKTMQGHTNLWCHRQGCQKVVPGKDAGLWETVEHMPAEHPGYLPRAP